MSDDFPHAGKTSGETPPGSAVEERHGLSPAMWGALAVLTAVLVVMYWGTGKQLEDVWTLVDSYYTHGFLVPFVSLYFVWRNRKAFFEAPQAPSAWGFVWIVAASLLLLVGSFLGFRVLGQFSIAVTLTGVSLALFGVKRTRAIWFPLAFLLFMVPIPPSLTQSISLHTKIIATQCAVWLANLMFLPMVREGSYIHFGQDKLLVGEVCGGLRSMIALLALGAIMAYISQTRTWSRVLLLLLSIPVAILSNVFRIFLLCLVGYVWGSSVAGGRFHDISGVLIYVVAFLMFFAIDAQFRRFFAVRPSVSEDAASASPPPRPGTVARHFAVALGLLLATTAANESIAHAQAKSVRDMKTRKALDIPSRIAGYEQFGTDAAIEKHVRDLLETSDILIRNYGSRMGMVQLTIVYAGTTRRSLHFPEVCLVGAGWEIREQTSTDVGLMFTARRLVLVKGNHREAVLYWFKTGDTLTGNYFLNAWYWVKDQASFGSSTSAMIKVATPVGPAGEEAAFELLEDFSMKFAPILLERVP